MEKHIQSERPLMGLELLSAEYSIKEFEVSLEPNHIRGTKSNTLLEILGLSQFKPLKILL